MSETYGKLMAWKLGDPLPPRLAQEFCEATARGEISDKVSPDGRALWAAMADLFRQLADAQEAAGEGVTEDCWYPVVSALGAAGETDPYTLGKAAVDAVHPVIFAAGERAGLEKAAAAVKALVDHHEMQATMADAMEFSTEYHDIAIKELTSAIAAIRALKGGTP